MRAEIENQELSGELSEVVLAARRRSATAAPVIAFANSGYLDVLMNWLVALAQNNVDNYLIVALDKELYSFLLERRIPAVFSELHGGLATLWIHRIRIFTALCSAGINFVHSDVDAVWLRDPRGEYFHDSGADLIISQGTIWPPDVHQRFGFVLCCGLFYVRSSHKMQRLFGELAGHVKSTGDDQVSLNRLLAARSPRWHIEPGDAYYTDGAGHRFLCSRSVMRGEGSDALQVAVLPHHLFQRVPVETATTPYVLHLLSPKDPAAKLKEFDRAGCLLVRPDWRSLDFDAGSIASLARGN